MLLVLRPICKRFFAALITMDIHLQDDTEQHLASLQRERHQRFMPMYDIFPSILLAC